MVESKVKVLVVTEDQSGASFQIYKNLAGKIFKNIFKDYDSRRVTFTEVDRKFAPVLSGNNWRQKRPRNRGLSKQIVEFKRYLTNWLLDKEAFILWHFDGDMAWDDFVKGKKFVTFEAFSKFVQPLKDELSGRETPSDRILPLNPFYSIEAWLYQNREKLKRLKAGTGDILALQPGEFDEIIKPKEKFKIKDKYNLELSKNFPFEQVYRLGKSFCRSVDEVKKCASLNNLLN